MKMLIVGTILVGTGACLLSGRFASAQSQFGRSIESRDDSVRSDLMPRVRSFERTDLFLNTDFPRPYSPKRDTKIVPREEFPAVLFQEQLRRSKSRQEYIEAAKLYLQREGYTVTKDPE